jgi:hypothetical protein
MKLSIIGGMYSWSDTVSKTLELYSSLTRDRVVDKSHKSGNGHFKRVSGLPVRRMRGKPDGWCLEYG